MDTTGEETERRTVFAGSGAGTETILLVEDDDDVRAVVGEILRSHGYTVLEAHDGDQALQLSAVHEGVIDLVVTDLVMPHMGGRELVDRMHAATAPTSGCSSSPATPTTPSPTTTRWARASSRSRSRRPDLVRKVREVLDSPRKATPATG